MSNLSEVAKQPVNIPASIPENWIWRDLVDICRPKQWATISSAELSETGYPVFGANGYIGFYPNYNHEFETIAVTCRGATCGTVNLIPQKTYITGNSMCLDDVHDSIDKTFLYYSAKYRTFSDVISGSAQPQITGEGLKKVSLPVPPLPEQKKIVSILTSVDEVIENTKKQIDKLQDLKKATMNELLTKGIGHTEFKDSELGRIPMSWDLKRLGQLCSFSGGNGFKEKYQGQTTGDYPFIKVSDMNHLENSKFINFSTNWIDDPVRREERIKLFPKNSIVFAKVGAALLLNRRRILIRETAIDNNLMAALPTNSDYLFLYYLLQSIDFSDFVQEGAVPSINQEQMDGIIVIAPPLPEQQKIASILTSMDEVIENTQKQIDKLQDLKKSLMQYLLTGKVRVKLH